VEKVGVIMFSKLLLTGSCFVSVIREGKRVQR